jgi:hypothetical protein
MITKEQVSEKCTELECDIFMDGPCYGSEEVFNKLGEMFTEAVNEKYNASITFDEDWYENIWEYSSEKDIDPDHIVDIGLEVYVNWVNKYDLEEEFNK